MKRKNLIITIGVLLIVIGVFLVIFKRNDNIENYKGTNINDEEKIIEIIKLLEIKYKSMVIDKIETPYGIRILLEEELEYYEYEKNANKMLYLIEDIEFVTFMYEDFTYNIQKNKVFKSIEEIDSYYKGEDFDNYEYLGTIGEYKVFDRSIFCVNEKQLIGSTSDYNYYVYCNSIENIYLVGETEITLKDAIENSKITIDDIRKLNITIYEEEI